MLATLEPSEDREPDVVPDILTFTFEGNKYILDPQTLKTQEDIVKVIKHFSTRVELSVFETKGIEKYVKALEKTNTH